MELWDILDADGNGTGRTIVRGMPLNDGDYHLVVDSWVMDSDGKFLITRRSPEKTYAGFWEPTSGSAIAGEDSVSAIIRETREETGLLLKREELKLFGRFRHEGVKYFRDVYFARRDFSDGEIVLQQGETDAFTRAYPEEIEKMMREGTFLSPVIMFYLGDMFKALRAGELK